MKVFRFATPLAGDALAALQLALLEQPGRVTMIVEPPRTAVTLAGLLAWVAREFRFDVATLERGADAPSVRRARAAAAWGARILLDSDLAAIAMIFGRRSHTGGRGLVAFAERLRATDDRFRDLTDRLLDDHLNGSTN